MTTRSYRAEVIRADPEWPRNSVYPRIYVMNNGRPFYTNERPDEPYPWVEDALPTIQDTRSETINQMTDRPIEDWHQ